MTSAKRERATPSPTARPKPSPIKNDYGRERLAQSSRVERTTPNPPPVGNAAPAFGCLSIIDALSFRTNPEPSLSTCLRLLGDHLLRFCFLAVLLYATRSASICNVRRLLAKRAERTRCPTHLAGLGLLAMLIALGGCQVPPEIGPIDLARTISSRTHPRISARCSGRSGQTTPLFKTQVVVVIRQS